MIKTTEIQKEHKEAVNTQAIQDFQSHFIYLINPPKTEGWFSIICWFKTLKYHKIV